MSPRLRNLLMTSTALLALGATLGAGPGGAQPSGPNVVGGAATVTGANTNSVIVNQTTDKAIINWNTFNISTGASATFNQPNSSSITLNRVTGGLGPSVIDGTITANGRVFIINRDGMLFGRNAVINTAGFLASTNDIRNADFMAGRMNFNIPGRGNASIVNFGTITAHSGGFAALVAPGVRNAGTISAQLGTVALASGNSFTLDMYGDKLIQIAVGDQIADKVIDVATGQPLSSLVSNEGTLRANGGRVEITAAAARHIVDSVINNKGVIEANSVGTRAGRIVLGGATQTAGLPKQTIKISGTITATGKDKGSKGGTIQITGEDIQFAAAMIDASGHSGGGKILVGGDYGGGRPIPGVVNNQSAVLENHAIATASTVTVDSATTFNASATVNGNGGKVILWSDVLTTFAGTIFARGGDLGGNGGFVEVSGKQSLEFSGMVNTLAPNGAAGTLLLDPFATTVSTNANSANNLNVDTLVKLLTAGNVTVTTSNLDGPPSGPGNLTISAGVTWTAATTLTLHAQNNLNINAPITAVNGGLTVDAGLAINAPAAINVGTFTLVNGNWTQQSATLPNFHATDFRIIGGQFLRVTGGDGTALSPYQIADVYGLQGIGSSSTLLNGNYRLANNIDASGTASWNNGQGFVPIGQHLPPSHSTAFAGSLDGQGFTINGLTIAPANWGVGQIQTVGLFGTIGATGSVSNLNITNASVATNIGDSSAAGNVVIWTVLPRASQWVGILAGENGGTISNVTVTGTVNGLSTADMIVGGLVGVNGLHGLGGSVSAGTIINSHANVNVTVADGRGLPCPSGCVSNASNAAGGLVGANVGGSSIVGSSSAGSVSGGAFTMVGGLVGQNGSFASGGAPSTITNSFSTANVSASGINSAAGGLVGGNASDATITGSHATGVVAASDGATAGGFVGENHGTITTSYATGPVTLTNSGATDAVAGGFAGTNDGTISGSYATGAVSSTNGDVTLGGFVGVNFNGITDSYATGNVTANGATLAMLGGFAGGNAGTITQSHATGNVSTNAATAMAGGFVGLNFGEITLSYATGTVAVGNNSFAGGFVGFNFGTINQAYAQGAVTAGANSFAGGFVGANAAADLSQFDPAAVAAPAASPGAGSITQSYALGSVTGGNATVVAAFAALNLGSLDQVYGAGRVQGGTSSTLGGLVGSSNATLALPSLFDGPAPVFSPGTTTNSYWDMQTTGLTTSAGGTGLNTAALVGGLPSGFDSNVWGNPAYPYLLNLGLQNTDPGTPVIPPVGGNDPLPANLPPADQQINPNVINPLAANDPVPNVTQFVEQQQQQQQRQAQSAQQTTGSIAQDPIRLEVGENRYFYLPPATETRLVSDEVVLQLPCNVPQAAVETVLKQHNLTVLASQCLAEGGNAAFRIRYASGQTISSVIRALADHQVVVAAQANYTYELTETKVQSATSQQGDPGQYVPEKLRLYSAHRIVTGNNVSIGVIDSEIDGAHPDLTGAIANKYDATGIDDNPHAHGTGMAGAIVSHQKLLGVAPGAQILAIRAFSTRNANPESTTFHILRGLDYAVANNVRIVNMSFAGPRDPSLERALKAAHDKGVVLIAAAGNAGPRAPAMYPAADPHVIAVTATDVDDRLFPGANRGNHVAIAAPGVDILVPAPAGEYQVTTGTSVATAHISGVVALMLERNPRLTPVDVRRILVATAKRIGPANMFGAGLVDTMKAIEMATPRSTEAPAPATTRPTTTAAAVRP